MSVWCGAQGVIAREWRSPEEDRVVSIAVFVSLMRALRPVVVLVVSG